MREKLLRIDLILFVAMILLVAIGIFMVYSTSVGDPNQFSFVFRDIVYTFVGLGFFFFVSLTNWKTLVNFSPWFYFLTVVLLLITFLVGIETRGSTRWIDFKFFTLQASEIAKPVLILTLAKFVNTFKIRKAKNILISLIIFAIPAGLIFRQPDLGSTMVLFVIWLSLIYLGGMKVIHLLAMGLLSGLLLPIGFVLLKGYQKERLLTFLNPGSDPLGSGYNLVQSIIAVGSGQMFGRGFGRGTQSHLNFLPEQKTDFIFATTAEELGFLGVVLILGLFSVLVFRILKIADTSQSKTAALICYGAVVVVVTQLFINAGMNMGIIPITGITLPFISFGGSSLVSMMILLGLVQSVKIHTDKLI